MLLGPERPAKPEKLMTSEALDEALEIADIMDGKPGNWHRQAAVGEEEEEICIPKLAMLTARRLQVGGKNLK